MSKQTSSTTSLIRWYWLNDDNTQWMPYGAVLQGTLEKRFLADRRDVVYAEVGDGTYEFNFSIMQQTNIQTGTCRSILRHTHSNATSSSSATRSDQQARNTLKRPATDNTSTDDNDRHHHRCAKCSKPGPSTSSSSSGQPRLVGLSNNNKMYTVVFRKFHETMAVQDFQIYAISEVKNDALWKKYSEKKGEMERISRGSSREHQLFHGTVDYDTVRCIYNQNFDPRVHGKNGTKYGKGAYFSATAIFSHTYTKPSAVSGLRYMFLTRVLVGQSADGREEYQRPPPVDVTRPHGTLYDSCVDNFVKPSIFVIFDSCQCVPEYVIEYKEIDRNRAPVLK